MVSKRAVEGTYLSASNHVVGYALDDTSVLLVALDTSCDRAVLQILGQKLDVAAVCQVDIGIVENIGADIKASGEVLLNESLARALNRGKVLFFGHVGAVGEAKEVHDANELEAIEPLLLSQVAKSFTVFEYFLSRNAYEIAVDETIGSDSDISTRLIHSLNILTEALKPGKGKLLTKIGKSSSDLLNSVYALPGESRKNHLNGNIGFDTVADNGLKLASSKPGRALGRWFIVTICFDNVKDADWEGLILLGNCLLGQVARGSSELL